MKQIIPITLSEHGTVTDEHEHYFKSDHINLSGVISFYNKRKIHDLEYLGLSNNYNDQIQAAYYIGAVWLKMGEVALIVKPKVKNIDFLKMFMHCYHCNIASKHIDKIYHIEVNKPHIKLGETPTDITPLLIIHYISLIKKIIGRGLKHDFIRVNENLNSKIKGKIDFTKHLKKNVFQNRPDRVFCNYQEYSVNCIENQILKKALLFSQNFIFTNKKDCMIEVKNDLNRFLSYFEAVGSNINIDKIRQHKINPLFKDYAEALEVAKMILQRFDYNITDAATAETTPPFWIDMSILFELYVLSLLHKKYSKDIDYQFMDRSASGIPDFLHKSSKIIIDTKYKLKYDNENEFNIEDIRQVAGYARSKKVLKKLGEDNDFIPNCLIIYPTEISDGQIDFSDDSKLLSDELEQFIKLYKFGIKLPTF